MELLQSIKTWLSLSHHKEHLIFGAVIYVISFLLCIILWLSLWKCAIISTFVVAGCMASAEYKDKGYGGKFDWVDIIAGMIVPIVVSIIIGIICLI